MNSLVKSKNLLDTFKKNNLNSSWATIQVGLELELLSLDEIHTFALDFSEDHPDLINEYIAEIIFLTDNRKIQDALKKVFSSLKLEFPTPHTLLWNKEMKKWRYCILKNITNQTQDTEELLIKIEKVYADFNYPKDMEPFIYYMPADEEVANLNPENARKVLRERLRIFLAEEKIKLANT